MDRITDIADNGAPLDLRNLVKEICCALGYSSKYESLNTAETEVLENIALQACLHAIRDRLRLSYP